MRRGARKSNNGTLLDWKILRRIKLHTTCHVGWHRHVDLLRVRQAKILHELSKLLWLLHQARIEHLLLLHGRHTPVLVVMARADKGGIGESEYLLMDTVMERVGVALLEVGSATTPDQQRVASEGKGGNLSSQDIGHTAIRVAWAGTDLQTEIAEVHFVSVLDVDARSFS